MRLREVSASSYAKVDLDAAVVHADRVDAHGEASAAGVAGSEVETQAVRRTPDRGALELPARERCAGMRAAVGDCVHGALDTEQGNLMPAVACEAAAASGQVTVAKHIGPPWATVSGGRWVCGAAMI